MSVKLTHRGEPLAEVDVHGVMALQVIRHAHGGLCITVLTEDGIKVSLFCEPDAVEQLAYSLKQGVDEIVEKWGELLPIPAEKGGEA